MIYNEKQYHRLFKVLKDFNEYNKFSYYDHKIDCSVLIIINKFFINQLLKKTNTEYNVEILNLYRNNLILKYLYKFSFISSKIYYLFNHNKIENQNFYLYDFFYF